MRGQQITAWLLRLLVHGAAAVTGLVLALLAADILWKGVPGLGPELFAWEDTMGSVSLLPALVNTVTLTAGALGLAVPIGVGAAVWLTEYARRESLPVRLLRLMAETLAGIPSVLFGLCGYLLFGRVLKAGYSLLAGILTVGVMVLPVILRTAEEALRAVPEGWREGSLALGAGRLRTICRIVLPGAASGMAAGVILAVGRIVGETAALIFTAGTAAGMAGLMESGRTLAVHMYVLWNEGLHMEEAYAVGAVLLALAAGLHAAAAAGRRREV